MKNILITGAANGIGLSIAKKFLQTGYNVFLTDSDIVSLKNTEEKLLENYQNLTCLKMDVSEEEEVRKTIAFINANSDGIDILVNNAGISPKRDGKALPLEEISLSEWEKVLKVNLTGTFLCTKSVIATMKRKHYGRIIHISSQSARTSAQIAGIHYAASKTAMIGFSRQIAGQLGSYNITSNCIAPGRIMSLMTSEVSEIENQKFLERNPIKRMGKPEEVAELAYYLASDEAAYITGTTIDINGGNFIN